MLSPVEWLRGAPDTHLGSYRLEYDGTWTPTAAIATRDARIDVELLGMARK